MGGCESILLEVKAQAYLIEGANARHEHEWAVWRHRLRLWRPVAPADRLGQAPGAGRGCPAGLAHAGDAGRGVCV